MCFLSPETIRFTSPARAAANIRLSMGLGERDIRTAASTTSSPGTSPARQPDILCVALAAAQILARLIGHLSLITYAGSLGPPPVVEVEKVAEE